MGLGGRHDHSTGTVGMAKRLKRKVSILQLGDVIELPLSKGYAYAQYVNNDRKTGFGELIRILPGKFDTPLPEEEAFALCREQEVYYCFFPIEVFLQPPLVRIIGGTTVPQSSKKMPHFKSYNLNPDSGKKTWFIWDGKAAKSRRVESLSGNEQEYPMRQVVSLETLVRRIESGWLPEHEAD